MPSKATGKEQAHPELRRLLSSCGLHLPKLDSDGAGQPQQVVLRKQQVSFFTTALDKAFREDVEGDREADLFARRLEDFLNSNEFAMTSCLSPMLLRPESSSCGGDGEDRLVKESLVRALLRVEAVQTRLFCFLMEKAVVASVEEEERDCGGMAANKQLPLSRLILSQVCWHKRLFQPDKLGDKVIEAVQCSSEGFQRELIASACNILDSSQHPRLAAVLKDMMKQYPRLTGIALDAFCCLSVGAEAMEDIRAAVAKRLGSTASEDLPGVVTFLLDTTPEGEEFDTVVDIRDNIDFSYSDVMSQIAQKQQEQQRQHQPQKKSSATDYDVLVLHIIEHKILSNPKFMSAWCRLLDGVANPKDHKPIDLLVFLALYAVPAKKGLMEKMLKQKVRRRIVEEDLVAKTMSDHPLAVKRHLDELLLLVGDLGQSADSALAEFSSVLRKEAFLHLDRAAQTEILIDLVRKIGYGTNQRSSAILALTRLAEDLTEMTRGFGSILESVLDHVTEAEMEFSEVRQVLGVVSRLAYANRESGSYLRDHLQIMIKKQVWSMRPQVVKLGIIGTVAAVKNMTSEDEGQQQDGDTTASTSADVSTQSGGGYFRDAKEMLKRVLDKAERNGEVGGLLMDELTGAVESGALPLKLQRYIVNKLTSNFQDDYVVDLEDGKPKGLEVKDLMFGVTAAYGADDDDEIALNLASVVAPAAGRKSSKAAALLPTFGLLKASVAASKDGNLDEILALLGCPVVMPTPVGIEKFEILSRGEQNARCHCLFYCANWFRELLNAFADTEDQEIRENVLRRLKDINRIHRDLGECLDLTDDYFPPLAYHSSDASGWKPARSKRAAAGVKRKAPFDEEEVIDDPVPSTSRTQTQSAGGSQQNVTTRSPGQDGSNDNSSSSLDLGHYSSFFRELRLEAFSVLSYGPLVIDVEPSREEERSNPQFRPPELAFLLRDLLAKLSRKLRVKKSAFPGRKATKASQEEFSSLDRLPAVEVAEKFASWIDVLLDNLEEISQHHQRILDLSEGDLGAPGMFNPQTSSIRECQELLYSCFAAFFSWGGFQADKNKPLLKRSLATLGKRAQKSSGGGLSDHLSSSLLCKAALKYLERATDVTVGAAAAVAHVKLIQAVGRLPGAGEDGCAPPQEICAAVAKKYLRRAWRDPYGEKEKGTRYNGFVETLLKALFSQETGEALKIMEAYVKEEIPRLTNSKGREAASETFPTLNRSTLKVHFTACLEGLCWTVKAMSSDDDFKAWESAVDIFHGLVSVLKNTTAKVYSSRLYICPVIKLARGFMESFMQGCMPRMDRSLKKNQTICIRILKNLQTSTRILQSACVHAKTNRDPSMVTRVPKLKSTLEAFLFRVKEALEMNGMEKVYCIGTLKTKDLHGNEILDEDEDEEEQESEEEEESDSDKSAKDSEEEMEVDDDDKSVASGRTDEYATADSD